VAAPSEDGESHSGDAARGILGGFFHKRQERFGIGPTGDAFDEIGADAVAWIEVKLLNF